MKLAIDALNLRNDRRGMGRVVRGVLRVALAAGVEVTLLSPERDPWKDDPDAEALAGARFAPVRTASGRAAYDVVWYPWNGIRFAAAVPSLAHIHDTFALQERLNWFARRRICRPLMRAARDASRVATDSQWSRAQIHRDLGLNEDEIVVIPLAPDPYFFPAADDAEDLPASPYVLMVGGGEPRKNAQFLIGAFAEAFPRGVRLVVVGELSDQAQALAKSHGVELLREAAGDARLRSLYRNAACVVVPSLAEGFGLVVVEAQASGAPVIASNASALPEAAGDAALLVGAADRRGWIDALRTVVYDEAEAARLRALGIARWSSRRRDDPARAILRALADLTRLEGGLP